MQGSAIMSITAISPVSYLAAASLVNIGQPQAPSPSQEDTQKTKTPDVSSSSPSPSGSSVAVQAFTAFPPAVQPIASLIPASDPQQTLPPDLSLDSTGFTPQWSGLTVDVYA
jgi:hypothetical protein